MKEKYQLVRAGDLYSIRKECNTWKKKGWEYFNFSQSKTEGEWKVYYDLPFSNYSNFDDQCWVDKKRAEKVMNALIKTDGIEVLQEF